MRFTGRTRTWVTDPRPGRDGATALVHRGMGADSRPIAVKWARDVSSNRTLERECALLRRLGALSWSGPPPIPAVLDEGRHEGRAFFVMPWFDRSVAGWLEEAPPLLERISVARALCRAVDRFHAIANHGYRPDYVDSDGCFASGTPFVHRDIKPDNLFFATDGHIVLGDFGGAVGWELNATWGDRREEVRAPLLSDGYSAPEVQVPRAAGLSLDLFGWECDIYSTGASVWTILTDARPRRGPELTELGFTYLDAAVRSTNVAWMLGRIPLDMLLRIDPTPPVIDAVTLEVIVGLTLGGGSVTHERAGVIAAPVYAAVARLLRPLPYARPASAAELDDALRAFQDALVAAGARPPPPDAKGREAPARPSSALASHARRWAARTWSLGGALASDSELVGIFGAMGLFMLLGWLLQHFPH